MRLIVICVFYPPIKSSAAIQISNLVSELENQGHTISVITTDHKLKKSFQLKKSNMINIYRFKTNKLRDISFIKRSINEFFMPFRIIFTIIIKQIRFNEC